VLPLPDPQADGPDLLQGNVRRRLRPPDSPRQETEKKSDNQGLQTMTNAKRTPAEFRAQFTDLKTERGGQNSLYVYYRIFVPSHYKVGRGEGDDFHEDELADAMGHSLGYWGGYHDQTLPCEGGTTHIIKCSKD
jgi:hypothetical protein